MKFSAAALLALAAAVTAQNTTISFTTITGTQFVTVCPVSSTINFSGFTYTNTYSTATTITVPCPGYCTQVVPIATATSVVCKNCPPAVVPIYTSCNATVPGVVTPIATGSVIPVTSVPLTSVPLTTVPANSKPYMQANGAERAVALSGAGLIALAAYVL